MRRATMIAFGSLIASFPVAAVFNIEKLASDADVIVVARASEGIDLPDGVGFRLTIVRTVRGKPASGRVLNVVKKLWRRPDVSPSTEVNGECGLYLLTQTQRGWEVLGSTNSPFLSDSRAPLGDCETAVPQYTAGMSAFEKSFAEIALAAVRLPADRVPALNLFDSAGVSDSALVARIMGEFSRSDVLPLKMDGVAWRVRRGDATALVEFVQLAGGPAKGQEWQQSHCGLAVVDYVNPDPSGVMALGRIVLDPAFTNPYLKRNAAHALRNIHTREAVPYLGELLDSPDGEIRAEAVSGLSEYAIGVRPVPDGPAKHEALDEAMNPGRRKTPLPILREYLHMGPFRSAEQEANVLAYWRGWWQANKADFPVPQFR